MHFRQVFVLIHLYIPLKTMTTATTPLQPLFLQFISASKKGRRLKYGTKKLTPGTIKQYECVLKLLREYETKFNCSLRIALLKKQLLPVIKKEKKYWTTFFRNFSTFLYEEKNCYDEYVGSVFKVIRTFFNYLLDDKQLPVGNFHKLFRIATEQTTPVILQPQQLKFLITDKEFETSLPLNLRRTKDIFVFGCTVGLRYSDLMRLRKEHVINSPEGKYLLIHTKKTGTEVRLPLPDYLLAIIDKYAKRTRKFILPQLSSTNLNLQVKRLGEKAGWTYSLPKIRYKQGRPVEMKKEKESCRFCDHITTHTMRRTAITSLLIMGVPELVVRRISGHAANSKEFYKYVIVAQDYLNRNVRNAYEQLLLSA
jgi:integrase